MSPSSSVLSLAAALAIGASAPAVVPAFQSPLAVVTLEQPRAPADQTEGRNDVNGSAAVQAPRLACVDQRGVCSADRETYELQRDAYDARFGAGAWEYRYGFGYNHRRVYQ